MQPQKKKTQQLTEIDVWLHGTSAKWFTGLLELRRKFAP